MEAEATGVVAPASDVVVDAQAFGHGHEVLDPLRESPFAPQMGQHCEWRVNVELAPHDQVCSEERDEQKRDRCWRKASWQLWSIGPDASQIWRKNYLILKFERYAVFCCEIWHCGFAESFVQVDLTQVTR